MQARKRLGHERQLPVDAVEPGSARGVAHADARRRRSVASVRRGRSGSIASVHSHHAQAQAQLADKQRERERDAAILKARKLFEEEQLEDAVRVIEQVPARMKNRPLDELSKQIEQRNADLFLLLTSRPHRCRSRGDGLDDGTGVGLSPGLRVDYCQ